VVIAVSLFLNNTRGIYLATDYYKKKNQSVNNRLEFQSPTLWTEIVGKRTLCYKQLQIVSRRPYYSPKFLQRKQKLIPII
jgi:hypothetical protein